MFAGTANLLIGAWQSANQEIRGPGFAPTYFLPTVLSDFKAIPVGSACFPAPFEQGGGEVPVLL
jgi:hypothetical protein